MLNSALRFVPYLRPTIWGGRRLGEMLAKVLPDGQPYGESWEVSDHPLHDSILAGGPEAGRSLRQLMTADRPALLGSAAAAFDERFPWLVKFLDASDRLSVQVHPDANDARTLCPSEGPKTESWFVLDAAPGSRIYAGLLPGIDEAALRAAIARGTVAQCLHQFEPRPGDCVLLPAGTVHSVGGGVLLLEVQQTSNATFRLFDWDRRDAQGHTRQLNVEKAIACIDWHRGPVEPVRAPGFTDNALPACSQRTVVHCDAFRLAYLAGTESFAWRGEGGVQLMIIVRGRGRLVTAGGDEELSLGQVWALPASLASVMCRPEGMLAVVRCMSSSD